MATVLSRVCIVYICFDLFSLHLFFVSLAIWDHTMLPATRIHLALTKPKRQTWFPCRGGIEGWVNSVTGYILRWFTRPQTVTVQVLTQQHMAESQTPKLLVTSPTP